MPVAKKKVCRKVKQQRHNKCSLLLMGKETKLADDWTQVIADEPLYFSITPEIVRRSVPRSAKWCVVAQALAAALGKSYEFQVGAGITKIFSQKDKVVVHFATPGILRTHLKKFDKTGQWDLPPNVYRLMPMPKSWDPSTQAKRKRAQKRAADKKNGQGTSITLTPTTAKRRRKKVTRLVLRSSLRRTTRLGA